MAEVNEEIVAQYLSLKKQWFYVIDIPFVVKGNYSNIDVLAYDPKTDSYYDIEVKFRSKYTMAAKTRAGKDISRNSVKWLVDQFTKYPGRTKKISEFTKGKKAKKLLITTKKLFGTSPDKRNALEAAFKSEMKKNKFSADIWYFDDMIPELQKAVGLDGRFNTQLLQTIRMINTYRDSNHA